MKITSFNEALALIDLYLFLEVYMPMIIVFNSMPGGVSCPRCKRTNTASVERVTVDFQSAYPHLIDIVRCELCGHVWSFGHDVKHGLQYEHSSGVYKLVDLGALQADE